MKKKVKIIVQLPNGDKIEHDCDGGLIAGLTYVEGKPGEADIHVEYGATNTELVSIVQNLLHFLSSQNKQLAVRAVKQFLQDEGQVFGGVGIMVDTDPDLRVGSKTKN